MAKIYSGATNWVDFNTTKSIHSGPGKLRGIIVSATADGSVFFYDHPSGTGTKLLMIAAKAYVPQVILFDNLLPITFTSGLTVVTAANVSCFVITEA
jgi:hypothetical protein